MLHGRHGWVLVTTRWGTRLGPQTRSSLGPKRAATGVPIAAAMCIGCGACAAACKNSSAMLFVAAKVSHLALLPQGDPERSSRVVNMITQMDKEGFGACTNTGACEATCPKEISLDNIARLNQEYMMAGFGSDR